VVADVLCPECGAVRRDPSLVCGTCGAPPIRTDDKRGQDEEVRSHDLEPYVTLRYIARLFKVLAVLMVVMLIGEIVAGLTTDAAEALPTLIGEITQMLVLAGLMWGGGDLAMLLIDAGHDVRVARILLGRINYELHRRGSIEDKKDARDVREPSPEPTPEPSRLV
jgi:hypothetical protein